MALTARLNQATSQKVRVPFHQPIDVGDPGIPLVNGPASGGDTLYLKGLMPGYAVQAGQFLSLIKNGRRYLHQVTQAAQANASGLVTLEVVPNLRIATAGNEVVEMALPEIEGLLESPVNEWTSDFSDIVTLTVAVAEAE
ncbi:hypothetical protein [Brevundimonas sp.]|uniref:hypothetical protein n=1 Tax=Brevundimonas sp. TaxID=1871086 RepID=UPI0035B2ACB7